MANEYIVIHPDGSSSNVTADQMRIIDGHLLFGDHFFTDERPHTAFAPGGWSRVVELSADD